MHFDTVISRTTSTIATVTLVVCAAALAAGRNADAAVVVRVEPKTAGPVIGRDVFDHVLTRATVDAHNDFGSPDAGTFDLLEARDTGGQLRLGRPPKSVAVLEVR